MVTTSAIKYQSSIAHPGFLEQIDREGKVVIGQFKNGGFVAADGFVS